MTLTHLCCIRAPWVPHPLPARRWSLRPLCICPREVEPMSKKLRALDTLGQELRVALSLAVIPAPLPLTSSTNLHTESQISDSLDFPWKSRLRYPTSYNAPPSTLHV